MVVHTCVRCGAEYSGGGLRALPGCCPKCVHEIVVKKEQF